MQTKEQKINIVKSTFDALAQSKNASGLLKMPLDVQDVVKEDQVVGVRLVSVLEPTAQFLYVPSEEHDFVASLTFPGDDAAVSSQLVLEVANAARSAFPDLTTNLVGVIAPVYSEGGIGFTNEGEQVYEIYKEFILRRSELIKQSPEGVAGQ